MFFIDYLSGYISHSIFILSPTSQGWCDILFSASRKVPIFLLRSMQPIPVSFCRSEIIVFLSSFVIVILLLIVSQTHR